MRGNNVVGLPFSNVREERVCELAEKRTTTSTPLDGRYRPIGSPFSSMVSCGVNKVGMLTKSSCRSPMDHLGFDRAQDLSRKRESLYILPPFGPQNLILNSRIDSLSAALRSLSSSKEEYVLLSNCDAVVNIDLKRVIATHMEKQTDIMIVYRYGKVPPKVPSIGVLQLDPEFHMCDILIDLHMEGECNFGMNAILTDRQLLMRLAENCISRNLYDFPRDLLQCNIPCYRVYACESMGFMQVVGSMNACFRVSMALTLPQIHAQFFCSSRPVYAGMRDDMPAHYGLDYHATNSLIANGCQVDGEVHNRVLLRGIRVVRGARLEDCVVVQDSIIGRGSRLNYVVVDKDVRVKEERPLVGL